MHLKELKQKTPAELVAMAEELEIEGASTMRRQDLMFCILRELAEDEEYEEKILGEIRAPKEGERYFALTSLTQVNYDDPEQVRHRTNFDNLTPLYPDEKLNLDTLDPTVKDKSARVIDIIAPQGKGQRALIVA